MCCDTYYTRSSFGAKLSSLVRTKTPLGYALSPFGLRVVDTTVGFFRVSNQTHLVPFSGGQVKHHTNTALDLSLHS
jgi:hypothetical protein